MTEFNFHQFEPTTGSDEERYRHITRWSEKARGTNPTVFDKLCEWLAGAGGWSDSEFERNRQLFFDIIDRFLRRNSVLREELKRLEPSGIVNTAVFGALDNFDAALHGEVDSDELSGAVSAVFNNFSALRDPKIRSLFAGNATGPFSTNAVEIFGYINVLDGFDSAVQYPLFMPDLVKRQMDGFKLESFEYKKLPAMRFIGVEKDFSEDPEGLAALLRTLDSLSDYRSGFDDDAILIHHHARGVDVEPPHAIWGRFMASNVPIPDGFESVDFVPEDNQKPGQPYLSQFARAVFSGDAEAMHRREGYDSDAMYDVTRNIILGQDVCIPYPAKYWTAEIFPEGFSSEKGSSVYLFGVQL